MTFGTFEHHLEVYCAAILSASLLQPFGKYHMKVMQTIPEIEVISRHHEKMISRILWC